MEDVHVTGHHWIKVNCLLCVILKCKGRQRGRFDPPVVSPSFALKFVTNNKQKGKNNAFNRTDKMDE